MLVDPGIPNTVDAHRLSTDDINRFAAMLGDAGERSIGVLHCLDTHPKEKPDEDTKKLIKTLGDKSEVARSRLPWWTQMVCKYRDLLLNIALARD